MSAIYRGTERFIVFVIGDTSTRAAANCRSVLSSKIRTLCYFQISNYYWANKMMMVMIAKREIVMRMFVCLSVCLSASISPEP